MAIGRRHEIADLRSAPGELSFEAQIAGRRERVWLRTDSELTPSADAALPICLLPAMSVGGTLRIPAPVSPKLLRGAREIEAIQRAWSREWTLTAPLERVEIEAEARAPQSSPPTGRVAAFFSGGVDSWATVLDNPDVTDLVFVRGIDLLPGGSVELEDGIEARVREAADELGLPLHSVSTNLRQLSDPLVSWEAFYGAAIAAVALFVSSLFDRVLISGDSDFEVQQKLGSNRLVDQLWSTEEVELAEAGGDRSRMEKVELISSHPIAQRSLRVCWENRDGAYNCGRCRKCLMTMIALEATGRRGDFTTFPPELDLREAASIELRQPVLLVLWEDLLDAIRRAGKREVEPAVAAVVRRGKELLDLPWDYRRRLRPGAPPLQELPLPGDLQPHAGRLLANAETAAAIADAKEVLFAVGSYDGCGNFGDIAQVDAALMLLSRLEPRPLVVTILALEHRQSHRELAEQMLAPPQHVVYLDTGAPRDPDLVEVKGPAALEFGGCYLYGGGYLNRLWGDGKLAMIRAAEAVLARGARRRIVRISSGLQVEPDYVAGLDPSDRALLRHFEPLGARDSLSHRVLAELGSAEALETGDDAAAVLARLEPEAVPRGEDLVVNVHYGGHSWVTGDPPRQLDFYARLLSNLAGRTERPLRVQPLVAYLDRRIDERAGAAELAAALSPHGIEVEETIVLRPASLEKVAPRLRRASLTLSSSYHVALTSLMTGTPVILGRDNAYYDQKAIGLLGSFWLPADWAARCDEDPGRVADLVAEKVFDPEEERALRAHIGAAAAQHRRRREDVEAALLRRIEGARSGPPVPPPFLRVRIDTERQLRRAEDRARAAERRREEARADLVALTGSRSWRLSGAARRLGTQLRRRTTRSRGR